MASCIEITAELMAGFLDEAPEYLEMLDAGLMEFEAAIGDGVLSLETDEDQERMNTMFRAAHSLKGLAAAFGFGKLKELTHQMETLFDQVRMGKKSLTSCDVEMLFQVFDRLKDLVGELSDPAIGPVGIEDVIETLDRVLARNGETSDGMETIEAAGPEPTEAAGPEPTEAAGPEPTMIDKPEPNKPVPPRPVEADAPAVPPQEMGGYGVFDDPELTALFFESTTEAIEELNQGLLRLEDAPADADLLNQIFRCAHNIKGASGAAGLTGMNRITHCMETVFDRLRTNMLTIDEKLMSALFETADRLRQVIDEMQAGTLSDVRVDEMVDQFAPWMGMPGTPAQGAAPEPPGSSPDASDPNDAPFDGDVPGDGTLQVAIEFPEGFDEAAIQAYLIHNKLLDIGNLLSSEPDINALTGDSPVTHVVFVLETDVEPASIEKALAPYGAQSVVVTDANHAAASSGGLPQADAPAATNVSLEEPPKTAEAPTAGGSGDSGEHAKPVNVKSRSVGDGIGAARPGKSARDATRPTKTAPMASRTAGAGNPEHTVVKTGETLRVDQVRLDELMNLGGELVINKARFVQIHGRFREVFDGKNHGYLVDVIGDRLASLRDRVAELQSQFGQNHFINELDAELLGLTESLAPIRSVVQRVHEARIAMHDFDEALHGLDRVSSGLQKGIMSTRMVPVGPLFTRFRRVVRDISKSCGKKVDLVLKGEQTELDKRMIDELGDPLTHMVRNSVDHGIELPEVRERAGKNPRGTLTLEACHRGNSICIEVSDDGAGVNVERVKAKMLEKELVTETQLEKMSDSEIVQYILKPGFSTAQTVTDLSGRGMGMDIVLAKLEQLNGTIEIDSRPGEGSRITIKLPLTLAILTSMVTRIGAGVYAVPLETVAEVITVKKSDIQLIQRRRVACIRDRIVPIAFFEDIFHTTAESAQTAARLRDELTLVIVGFEREQLGLAVDELLGQEDVVIKSIAENYRNVRGFAGASIRGDGTVSLILDVPAMMEMAGAAVPPPGSLSAESEPKETELVEA